MIKLLRVSRVILSLEGLYGGPAFNGLIPAGILIIIKLIMSVKVAVRVRPFNDREQGSKCVVRMVGVTLLTFLERTLNYNRRSCDRR